MKTKILRHVLFEKKDDDELKNTTKKILKECSDYIPYVKSGDVLFRGVNSHHNLLFQEYPRNRGPLNSTTALHDLLNEVFAIKGFKTNRSNSIFCTGVYSDASGYGNVYIVFPKNGFNFLWSPKILDAYNNVDLFKETKISKKMLKTMSLLFKQIDIPQNFKREIESLYATVLRTILHFNANLMSKPPLSFDVDYSNIYNESVLTNDPKYYIYSGGERSGKYYNLYDVFPFLKKVNNISDLPNTYDISKHIKGFLEKLPNTKNVHNIIMIEIYRNLILFFFNKFLPKSKNEIINISPKEINVGYRENDNLHAAVRSGNEIMLSGSGGVYLVKQYSKLHDSVFAALGIS